MSGVKERKAVVAYLRMAAESARKMVAEGMLRNRGVAIALDAAADVIERGDHA